MAYITTAYINNGTLLAQANKVAVAARLVASAASGLVTLDLNTAGTLGTYNNVVTDAYGRVVSGTLNAYLTTNQTITISGDASGSGTTAITLTLASITTAGTYTKVVTDVKGRVVSGGALQSSDVTTALGFTPISTAAEGANNGVATLNGSGQLTASQIPSSLVGGLVYQGTWNASTNSPTLTSGTGTNGWFYKVATAGTTTLDGIAVWNVGDSAVFEIPSGGTVGTWGKIDGITNEVISVAGMTGVVTLTVSNVSGAAPLASPAFTGTPTAPTPLSTDSSGNIATTSFVKEQNYITGNQTITISGDASGSGTTAITLTLASVGTAGAYTAVTTDAKGRVISGSNLTVTGDVTGTASGASIALTLATVATAGTYQSVVVNTKGLVTSGASLTSANVTTALGYTPINIASGTFTGVPAAPTAAYGTNTTQLATTAFVEKAQGNFAPTIFVSGATNTLTVAQTGAMVEATGTVATAVSVVAATGIPGQSFTIWNNSTAATTLTSAGGNFAGPNGSGSTTLVIPAGAALDITSDGTVWAASGISYASDGGPWLNLTGGTLTGALVGTTASFTGGVATGSLTATNINSTPVGNITPSTGAFTTLTSTGATSTGSLTATNINSTPVGNVTPSTGAFTTLTSTGATSTGSLTATVINSTPIGATTPSTGAFTTLTSTGATSTGSFVALVINSTPIGTTTAAAGAFTTLSATTTPTGTGFTNLLAPYAPLASPALTGVPTAPTAAYGTSTTQLATTAFVENAQGNSNPTIFITGSSNTLTGSQTGSMVEAYGTVATSAIIATAVGISGQSFQLFNNSTVAESVTSQGGNFAGPGGNNTTAITIPVGAIATIKSDGTNWITGGFAYSGNVGPWLQLSGGTLTGTVALSTTTAPTVTLTDNSTNVATTAFVKGQSYLTGNQSITLSGDATGTGTTAITVTLATVNSTPGTFTSFVVNGKGLVTSGSNLAISGDASGTASGAALTLTLATVNSTPGTFTSFVVNGKGLVTAGSNLSISGDASGTASGNSVTLTLATVNATPGTYSSVVVNGKGLVTSGSAYTAPWTRVAQTTASGTIANSGVSYVGVNYAGAVSLTLTTGSSEGRILYIKDESGNAYANNITINSTENIDGASSTILNVNYEGVQLIFSGSSWRQM